MDEIVADIDVTADHKSNELLELLRESRNTYRRQAEAFKGERDALSAEVARLRAQLDARHNQTAVNGTAPTTSPANVEEPPSEDLARFRQLDSDYQSLKERAAHWESHNSVLFGEREALVNKLKEAEAAHGQLVEQKQALEAKVVELKSMMTGDGMFQAHQALEQKLDVAEDKCRFLRSQLNDTQATAEELTQKLLQRGETIRTLKQKIDRQTDKQSGAEAAPSPTDKEGRRYAPYPTPSTSTAASAAFKKAYSPSPPPASSTTFGLRPVDWSAPPAVRNPYISGAAGSAYPLPPRSADPTENDRASPPMPSPSSLNGNSHRLSYPGPPPSSSARHPSMTMPVHRPPPRASYPAPSPRPAPPPPPPADFEPCLMCRVTQRVCEPQTGKKSRACKPCAKNKARCSLSAPSAHAMRVSDSDSDEESVHANGAPARAPPPTQGYQPPRSYAPPPPPSHGSSHRPSLSPTNRHSGPALSAPPLQQPPPPPPPSSHYHASTASPHPIHQQLARVSAPPPPPSQQATEMMVD